MDDEGHELVHDFDTGHCSFCVVVTIRRLSQRAEPVKLQKVSYSSYKFGGVYGLTGHFSPSKHSVIKL